MTVPTITPQELFELTRQGAVVELIDVRTPAEFREVHEPFARNVPLDQVDLAAAAAAQWIDDRIIDPESSRTPARLRSGGRQLTLLDRERYTFGR